MGYYVNIEEANWVLPKENQDVALQRLKDLNHKEGVEKRGGSFGPGGVENERWFSWMSADYDQHVSSVAEILSMLGFDFEYEDDGGLRILFYDSKIGQEELFLTEIADLVPSDSFIKWRGEDGEHWMWTPSGVFEGRIVYDKEVV
jgi:hypothetical protein